MDMPLVGHASVHRRLFENPMWKGRPQAALLFVWLFGMAAYQRRIDKSFKQPVELERGQMVTNYQEICRWNSLSVKQARNALAWLKQEKMVTVDERRELGASIITVVNYPKYQGGAGQASALSLHGDKGAPRGQSGAGQTTGQTTGQTAAAKTGRPARSEKALSRKGKRGRGRAAGAEQNGDAGQTGGQTTGQTQEVIINKEVNKKLIINNPLPPFTKGGRVFPNSSNSSTASEIGESSVEHIVGSVEERRRMVLALWREAREAAGLGYFADERTVKAAHVIADEWLGGAQMTVYQVREGFKKLCRYIKDDPKCKLFTLRTLLKSPNTYCPPPPIEKKKRILVCWEYVCDVCDAVRNFGFEAPGKSYPPQPCVNSGEGCQGTMYAKKIGEKEL